MANAYAITHDALVYAEPDTFNPDRYIPADEGGAGEPLPVGHFGFGRRYDDGILTVHSWVSEKLTHGNSESARDSTWALLVPGLPLQLCLLRSKSPELRTLRETKLRRILR
jgi:hypothetical protein